MEIGSTILYGDKKHSFYKDVIEYDVLNKLYYGKYLENNAITEKVESIDSLLKIYINEWSYVSIENNDKVEIIKNIENDLIAGYKMFEKRVSPNILIVIISYKGKQYYLEYINDILTDLQKLI